MVGVKANLCAWACHRQSALRGRWSWCAIRQPVPHGKCDHVICAVHYFRLRIGAILLFKDYSFGFLAIFLLASSKCARAQDPCRRMAAIHPAGGALKGAPLRAEGSSSFAPFGADTKTTFRYGDDVKWNDTTRGLLALSTSNVWIVHVDSPCGQPLSPGKSCTHFFQQFGWWQVSSKISRNLGPFFRLSNDQRQLRENSHFKKK